MPTSDDGPRTTSTPIAASRSEFADDKVSHRSIASRDDTAPLQEEAASASAAAVRLKSSPDCYVRTLAWSTKDALESIARIRCEPLKRCVVVATSREMLPPHPLAMSRIIEVTRGPQVWASKLEANLWLLHELDARLQDSNCIVVGKACLVLRRLLQEGDPLFAVLMSEHRSTAFIDVFRRLDKERACPHMGRLNAMVANFARYCYELMMFTKRIEPLRFFPAPELPAGANAGDAGSNGSQAGSVASTPKQGRPNGLPAGSVSSEPGSAGLSTPSPGVPGRLPRSDSSVTNGSVGGTPTAPSLGVSYGGEGGEQWSATKAALRAGIVESFRFHELEHMNGAQRHVLVAANACIDLLVTIAHAGVHDRRILDNHVSVAVADTVVADAKRAFVLCTKLMSMSMRCTALRSVALANDWCVAMQRYNDMTVALGAMFADLRRYSAQRLRETIPELTPLPAMATELFTRVVSMARAEGLTEYDGSFIQKCSAGDCCERPGVESEVESLASVLARGPAAAAPTTPAATLVPAPAVRSPFPMPMVVPEGAHSGGSAGVSPSAASVATAAAAPAPPATFLLASPLGLTDTDRSGGGATADASSDNSGSGFDTFGSTFGGGTPNGGGDGGGAARAGGGDGGLPEPAWEPFEECDGEIAVAAAPNGGGSDAGSAAAAMRVCDRFQPLRDQPLGSGAFGDVFKAWDAAEGVHVAAKEMRIVPGERGNSALRELFAEFRMLTTLSHPNVVRVLAFSYQERDRRASIFMEWLPSGSVQALLRATRRPLATAVVRRYARDATAGLAYLHSRGILHRDIKPGNMLIDASGKAKLSDFGTSRLRDIGDSVNTGTVVGTVSYLAPECVRGVYSNAGDVWALAASVLEMATGAAPWSDAGITEPLALLFHVGSLQPPRHHPTVPAALAEAEPQLADFLARCFAFDRRDRPTAEALLSHPFLATAGSAVSSTVASFASSAAGTPLQVRRTSPLTPATTASPYVADATMAMVSAS